MNKNHLLEAAIVANGEIESYSITQKLLSAFHPIVAADGGLVHCDAMGIEPSLIVGDLDSIPSLLLKKYHHIPLLKFPVDKDFSDLELCIDELLKQGIEKITLFGVLGKRVDHLLYTLHLVTRFPEKLRILSENETLFAIQKTQDIHCSRGQTISLIPLSKVTGVHTKGLKWEIQNGTFDKHFMSLSNICQKDTFSVSIDSGDLICCMQHPC